MRGSAPSSEASLFVINYTSRLSFPDRPKRSDGNPSSEASLFVIQNASRSPSWRQSKNEMERSELRGVIFCNKLYKAGVVFETPCESSQVHQTLDPRPKVTFPDRTLKP